MSNTSSQPTLNAPIHIECTLLKHVVLSVAEAEIGALFHNAKTAIHIRKMLEALGHRQQTIRIKTDNSTAESYCNKTLKEKRSKSWDMRWWWLQDKIKNKEFHVYLDKGKNNYVYYHTKHFPPLYHQQIRPKYILKGYNISLNNTYVRGCVNPPLGVITKDIKSSITNH